MCRVVTLSDDGRISPCPDSYQNTVAAFHNVRDEANTLWATQLEDECLLEDDVSFEASYTQIESRENVTCAVSKLNTNTRTRSTRKSILSSVSQHPVPLRAQLPTGVRRHLRSPNAKRNGNPPENPRWRKWKRAVATQTQESTLSFSNTKLFKRKTLWIIK